MGKEQSTKQEKPWQWKNTFALCQFRLRIDYISMHYATNLNHDKKESSNQVQNPHIKCWYNELG